MLVLMRGLEDAFARNPFLAVHKTDDAAASRAHIGDEQVKQRADLRLDRAMMIRF